MEIQKEEVYDDIKTQIKQNLTVLTRQGSIGKFENDELCIQRIGQGTQSICFRVDHEYIGTFCVKIPMIRRTSFFNSHIPYTYVDKANVSLCNFFGTNLPFLIPETYKADQHFHFQEYIVGKVPTKTQISHDVLVFSFGLSIGTINIELDIFSNDGYLNLENFLITEDNKLYLVDPWKVNHI